MVVYWWFTGDLMGFIGFNDDSMGFNCDLIGFNGIWKDLMGDLMGITGIW